MNHSNTISGAQIAVPARKQINRAIVKVEISLAIQIFLGISLSGYAQSWDLTRENIDVAIRDSAIRINQDSLRPAFHLTPPVGCMGDPNGGIYHNGWYHIFYGLQPFAFHPGGWYWAQARSRDLLHWEHMETGLTPAFDLGLSAVGSGSTIVTDNGEKYAFHSQSTGGAMKFWRTEFTNDDLSEWNHSGKNPVLTLEHPGIPHFDDFWRDPFVFEAEGRTFLIACADLLDADSVPVPIFEALNSELTDWKYQGTLFSVPKYRYRNLEVPELRKLGDQWIFLASTDAPVDRCIYFVGDFDTRSLRFKIENEGIVDYSGHYYAQETIQDEQGDLYLMAWMPGWDRPWLPTYMNAPLKNDNPLWNGCFALPRKLSLDPSGRLIQTPVNALKELRSNRISLPAMLLPVAGPTTSFRPVDFIHGDQLELKLELDLYDAAFCGLTLLGDVSGHGAIFINWSGDVLNVDGIRVPITDWNPGDHLKLRIFIDNELVEIFVNDGKYCISRQVVREQIRGDRINLTSLGGTARLVSMEAWDLGVIRGSGLWQSEYTW